jgi:hypothetical protein
MQACRVGFKLVKFCEFSPGQATRSRRCACVHVVRAEMSEFCSVAASLFLGQEAVLAYSKNVV